MILQARDPETEGALHSVWVRSHVLQLPVYSVPVNQGLFHTTYAWWSFLLPCKHSCCIWGERGRASEGERKWIVSSFISQQILRYSHGNHPAGRWTLAILLCWRTEWHFFQYLVHWSNMNLTALNVFWCCLCFVLFFGIVQYSSILLVLYTRCY